MMEGKQEENAKIPQSTHMRCHMGQRHFRDINHVSDDVSAERRSRTSWDPVKTFLSKSSSDGAGSAPTNILPPVLFPFVA